MVGLNYVPHHRGVLRLSQGKKIGLWWVGVASLWMIFAVMATLAPAHSPMVWTWLGSMFFTEAIGVIVFMRIMCEL
jgi:hypothetical protein